MCMGRTNIDIDDELAVAVTEPAIMELLAGATRAGSPGWCYQWPRIRRSRTRSGSE